jgi:cytochrome c-type biogenesis protein
MIDVPIALSFTAGLVAAVNPCGFPMLPAYLSFFIGGDDDDVDARARVPRALLSAGAVSIGFLAVFAALGIPINAGVTSLYRWMPWLTIVIGGALLVLGTAMLLGWHPPSLVPRLDRGGGTRQFGSMALFGVSYAVTSLSCTLPIFLTYVLTVPDSFAGGIAAFLAYGAGMTLVLMSLSVAVALARESMVRRMRTVLAYVDRIAGVLLLLVGAYLVLYGVHAMDPTQASTSPIGWVGDWSSQATSWLGDGGTGLGLVLFVLVLAAAAGAVAGSRRRRS